MIDPSDGTELSSLAGGRYSVVGLLGSGAQGSTLLAVQEATGRHVAIKRFVVKGARSWKDVELAEREAAVLASLSHPRLPAYVEHFEEGGALYLVMERIEGVPLFGPGEARGGDLAPPSRALARLGEAEVVRMIREVGEVLAYLHGRAPPVVHRDVKPGNVLVSRAGLAKLTDFGIARLEDAQVTREGILLGTPSYMSPEQLAGRRGAEIDGRSDLYSLAVVIYELVARKHPHGIKPKSDIYDIIRIKNEQDPAPLTVEGAEELAPLLARALARRPEDRFASAGEMAVALKRVAASKRALKDELARRVAAAARASAARNRRKRAATPRDALANVLAAAPWRRYAAVAMASAAALGLAAGLWVSRHPDAAARIEAAAKRTLEHTVIPVLERARHEAGDRP